MANKKISDLTQLNSAHPADIFPIVDMNTTETKYITVSNLMGTPGAIGIHTASSGKFTTLQLLHGVTINEISSDDTLSGNSNLAVPTERSVKVYIDNAIGSISSNHNDLTNLQGGDSTANEYYHLTNERYTFLSTLTKDHNDLTNLQGGDSTANEYYHLTNERYTFLSTLTKNHNALSNLQGGDSTANEYYHVDKDIYDGLFSNTSIIGIGNFLNTNLKIDYGSNVITGNINNSTELQVNSNGLSLKTGAIVNRISNDGFFINNSPIAVVTEQAIKTYVDNNSGGGGASIVRRVSIDSTALANYILLVDTTAGNINIKLLGTLNGKITVKKISNDLNRVIITSTKKIDGFNEYIIYTPNQSYNFLVDSGDFFVI